MCPAVTTSVSSGTRYIADLFCVLKLAFINIFVTKVRVGGMFTFEEIFGGELSFSIQQSLLLSLDTLSVIRLGRTCKVFWSVCANEWKVEKLFDRYGIKFEEFRVKMREYSAVISGGLILQFLDREVWEESDMDVYVKRGSKAKAIRLYIVEQCGYELCPKGDNPESWTVGIQSVVSYVKTVKGRKRCVQVMSTMCAPEDCVLRGFDRTAVMNIATADRIYGLFPRTTFVDRNMVVLREWSAGAGRKEKYEARGWTSVGWKLEEELQQARRIGDSMCWVMKLNDTKYVFGEHEEDSRRECKRFAVGKHGCVILRQNEVECGRKRKRDV